MRENTFVKKIDVSDGGLRFRIEAAKSHNMVHVLEACPNMFTPRLIDADEATGKLVFERIENLQPLHCKMARQWFEQIGALLAIIHDNLCLPSELTIVRNADRERTPLVYVHSDFQPGNLAIAGDRLVVFDWGARPWGDEFYTQASPAVDLASFLAPWFLPKWWDFRFPVAGLRAFVTSYLSASRNQDRATLASSTLPEAMQEHYLYNGRAVANRRQPARAVYFLKNSINTWRFERKLLRRINHG